MFECLPPCEFPDMKECALAREVYENAVFISVEANDIKGFEQHMAILKTYYDDLASVLPQSQKMYPVLGLYLLYLLAYNKISEYHTELELIPFNEHSNVYINVPVSLEQYFVDGNYLRILNTKQNLPLAMY